MKALLLFIGIILAAGAEGASKQGSASGTQIAVMVLIAFALIGISSLIPEREYKK